MASRPSLRFLYSAPAAGAMPARAAAAAAGVAAALAAPPAAPLQLPAVVGDVTRTVYGKYWSRAAGGGRDSGANSYVLYRPPRRSAAGGKFPLVVDFCGGGWVMCVNSTIRNDDSIAAMLRSGVAYAAVSYRLINTRYYYGDGDGALEELIHVDAEGRLTVDRGGQTMADYEVRRIMQEHETKCSYDAAQAMEHLIRHADAYGIDVHRVAFYGESAGGGELHYLTWVYHRWNVGRYTPVSIAQDYAQLDYPVQSMLDRVWGQWADDVGGGVRLATIMEQQWCEQIVGNCGCTGTLPAQQYALCNRSWHDATVARFCGDRFGDVTIAELRDTQTWPSDDVQVGKGMEALWYNTRNMLAHPLRPFHVYANNPSNDTTNMGVVHAAKYALGYARAAAAAGMNYTVYYSDYYGMRPGDAGAERVAMAVSPTAGVAGGGRNVTVNYRSSHRWADHPGVRGSNPGSWQELLLFHCYVLGARCAL